MIIAYGLGGLVGPPVGGAEMDVRNPQGLLWLFVLLFVGLLAGTWRAFGRGRGSFRMKE